jgi:hypothetical protein
MVQTLERILNRLTKYCDQLVEVACDEVTWIQTTDNIAEDNYRKASLNSLEKY